MVGLVLGLVIFAASAWLFERVAKPRGRGEMWPLVVLLGPFAALLVRLLPPKRPAVETAATE